MNKSFYILIFLGISISMFCQDPPTIDLNTKMGDEATVPNFIEAVDWQQNTPLRKKDLIERIQINDYILEWAKNTKLFTLDLNQYIVPDDCGECTISYMGNAGKYALQNKNADENSIVNAGVQAMIEFYKNNKKTMGESEFMEKMITIQDSGDMPEYIANVMFKPH